MKLFTVVLLCAVIMTMMVAGSMADPIEFRTCMEDGGFELKTVDMTPVTPAKGDNVTIKMEGIALEGRTDSGVIETKVALKNIPVFEFKYDLCKVSTKGCPILAGDWSGVLVQPVPKIAFPGKYTSRTISKVDDKVVSCVEFDFQVVRE